MTTTIVPSAGAGIVPTQQGTGATPGYSALDVRRAFTVTAQEGVYGTATSVTAGGVAGVQAADFLVSQRGVGANMSVDVNMPAGGSALVQGDTVAGQGLYFVPVHASNVNELLSAADATNPRVDIVILEVQDNALDSSGGNLARTRVIAGTPTSGATLTNRLGAPVLPANALLLADMLVAANATTIGNAVIRDRRKWARGAFWRGSINTDVSSTSLSAAVISASLAPRLECSGTPLRLALNALGRSSGTNTSVIAGCFVDAAAVDGIAVLSEATGNTPAGSGLTAGFHHITTPTAGSHLFQPTIASSSTTYTGSLLGSVVPIEFIVEEILRPVNVNNVVTSG